MSEIIFAKTFDIENFDRGIDELKSVCYSAADSIGDVNSFEDVLSSLAHNAGFHRPTGNGVDWDAINLRVSGRRVDYNTSGGQMFGWWIDSAYSRGGTPLHDDDQVTFYVVSHSGGDPEESTLARSCIEAGWEKNKVPRVDFKVIGSP